MPAGPSELNASRARAETLNELKQANLAKMKRLYVFSFGATEGLLLDRFKSAWGSEYFKHALSMDALFELKPEQ